MTQAAWQVQLKDASGNLSAILTQETLLACQVTKVVNGVHTYALTIDATKETRHSLFVVGGQVEIWRKPASEAWYKEFEGFHRVGVYSQDEDGRETFVSQGVGYQDLLARRAIVAYSGSAEAEKSGAAETIIKAYVSEQLGSSASADRQVTGFSVQADAASGNTISISRAYRNLLEVCQEIAEVGGGDFDVVGTGAGLYEFRWYAGQRGTDRRSTVTFSTGYGNMKAPALTKKPASANVVLVLGQGTGSDRTWVWRPAAGAPTGASRFEVVRDARDTDSAGVMDTRGDVELEAGVAQNELQFETSQVSAYRYGVDYGLGDLVTAYYRDALYDLKIAQVEIALGDPDDVKLEFENV